MKRSTGVVTKKGWVFIMIEVIRSLPGVFFVKMTELVTGSACLLKGLLTIMQLSVFQAGLLSVHNRFFSKSKPPE